jgi:hypothetical protein
VVAPLPQAGEPFTIRLTAARDVTEGRLQCRASVAGVRLHPKAQRLAGRRASCTFRVPEDSAGKTLRATIAVSAQGVALKKSIARTIR